MHLILAIDDDQHILKLLDRQVKEMGHKLILAQSGKQGLDLAMEGKPDLILLDIMMPEIDGFAVIKKLRVSEVTKKIPIIMLTSKSGKTDVAEAMRYGVFDYIIKPYNFLSFSKKIETALRYSDSLKMEEETDRDEHVTISRERGRSYVSFKTNLDDKSFLGEIKNIFNSSFLAMTKRDTIVLDLRSINDFQENEIELLKKIMALFGKRESHIVAGKHYGLLVAMADFDQNVHLFISLGDFEIFIEK